MKNLMKFFVITLLTIGTFIFNSCSENDEIHIPPEISGELNIKEKSNFSKANGANPLIYTFKVNNTNQIIGIESSIQNNHLNSTLKIQNGNSKWTELTSFSINIADKAYKQKTNLIIEDKANLLKKKYDYKKIRDIENILDNLPEILFNQLGEQQYFKETTLSIFYHLGIFKSAMRSYENNTINCNCETFESYIKEESPFFCAEDKAVSADEVFNLVKKISDEREFAGKKFIPKKTLAYLKSKSGEYLSVSKADKILKDEFKYFWNNSLSEKDIRTKIFHNHTLSKEATLVMTTDSKGMEKLPYDPTCLLYGADQGSDCGCCGNYSGSCWKCLLECYIHDQTCETCTPSWYCFSGCVSGSC